MRSEDFYIQTIQEVTPYEFFGLIERNRSHLTRGFPVTVSLCISEEDTEHYFQKKRELHRDSKEHYFYVRNKLSSDLIGYVCIKNIDPKLKKGELAYFIDRAYQGRGIISKVVSQTVAFCFNQLQLDKVFICTARDNYASQKVAVKNGFIQEGILRNEHRTIEGDLEDVVYLGLLKSDAKQ